MNEVTDQKRLELAYKRIVQLEEKIKTDDVSGNKSRTSGTVPVAVIGTACRFPGDVKNSRDLWNHFEKGINVVKEIPSSRWNLAEIFSEERSDLNKTYCKYGAFFNEIDQFDPLFFNISPKEAERMDPQQRFFLQGCWEAFEDAGYNDSRLNGSKCGVYAGSLNCDYTNLLNTTPHDLDLFELMGTQSSILSARISYLMNLKGPSITVDTACSSSLIAIDLAVKAIQAGEIDIALAGGVHLYITPNLYIMMSKAQMLSEDGQSKAFDNGANGFAPGEGMAVVVLKSLDKAIADGDQIYGVILGGTSNQDGKTNGITAPSSLAQTELQTDAYTRLNINPSTIGYLEAHGTGTKLGDPIEFEALTKSFRQFTDQTQFCAIGSSKTNFGHTLSSAGVAGVLKALLAMKHKKIPANLNFNAVNEHLEYHSSPFYINNTLLEWPQPENFPRRSAVNSFGFSGTNVHLVLEEAPYLNDAVEHPIPRAYLILLSAKTAKALEKKVADIHRWLIEDENPASLKNISLTLMRGRCHFKYRTALVVNSRVDLLEKLETWSQENQSSRNISIPEKDINALVDHLADFTKLNQEEYQKDLGRLADLYCAGATANWAGLLINANARTVSLPTYPFENEKHWITPSHSSNIVAKQDASDKSFSFFDSNESTLEAQCYQKTFTGKEFYLRDHVVNLHKMLPGVAYLEMARSSGNHCNKPFKVTRIENVVWENPIVVDGDPKTVKISLHPNGDKVDFQIFSVLEDNLRGKTHSTGTLSYAALAQSEDEFLDVEQLRKELPDFMSQKQCYDSFKEKGLFYGSSFKRILNLSCNQGRALATIEGREDDMTSDALHPGILDAALQALLVLVNQLVQSSKQHYLPYTLASLELRNPLTSRCYSYVSRQEKIDPQDPAEYFDAKLTDENGKILLVVGGLKLVPIKRNMDVIANIAEPMYFRSTLTPSPIKEIFVKQSHPKKMKADKLATYGNKSAIVIFGDHDQIDKLLDKSLLAQDLSIIEVQDSPAFSAQQSNKIALSLKDPGHVSLLRKYFSENGISPQAFVWLGLSKSPDAESATAELQFITHLIKELIKSKAPHAPRFICTDFVEDNNLATPRARSAFFKTLTLENPDYLGKHLTFENPTDISSGSSAESSINKSRVTQQLLNEIFTENFSSGSILYQGNERYQTSLEKIDDPEATISSVKNSSFKAGGVYLITGGLKGIGLELAKCILHASACHLILVGRSELNVNDSILLKETNQNTGKGTATYYKADVANFQEVGALHEWIIQQFKQLNGVLHCAGVKRDSFIIKKESSEVAAVLSAKVSGTINLDAVTKNDPLDFFVLFSSIAAVFGNTGQSDYAFANGFMDDFAAYRQKLGEAGSRAGKSLSINWPLWQSGGMQLDEGTAATMKDLFGMQPLDAKMGFRALETCLQLPDSNLMHLLGDPIKTDNTLKSEYSLADQDEPEDLTQLDEKQRQRVKAESEHFLKLLISDEMKVPYEKLDADAAFENFGMDSVVYMSLNRKLEEKFGRISKTLFYEYQNISTLADYFLKNHLSQLINVADVKLQQASTSKNSAKSTTSIQSHSYPEYTRFKSVAEKKLQPNHEIAIIGIGGKYPQANTLDEFWQNLLSGKDCVEEIPADRWDHSQYFDPERGVPGKTYSKWGGFIQGHDNFDPFFFNISPKEACLIDPQERLFLQTAWQAVTDAGYTSKSLATQKVGVYAGVMWSQYQLLGIDPEYEIEGSLPDSLISSVANRVSYFFDLHGPSVGLDTMCSSSLTAVHMACEAIKSGEIDCAIAGGVNLIVHPNKYLRLAQGNFASSDGRCRSFGAGGNGYVPGEGVGVILLKPLEQSLKDRDHIYGVIKASHINHGGKTNGYTVPNPVQQGELIKEAIKKAGVNPEAISYMEAHGTGTELGDPIEITGLTQAYGAYSNKKSFCALGSVKSNIGHLESAAGVSAITKILLQLKHDTLVPTLHCEEQNPNIDLLNSPFYLQKNLSGWSELLGQRNDIVRKTRCAAVSSFGASGSNAHLIIEEAPVFENADAEQVGPYLFIFSAKDTERLNQYLQVMVEYLVNVGQKNNISLKDTAYTLQIGRDIEAARLAVVATNYTELITRLRAHLAGEDETPHLFCGNLKQNKNSALLPTGESGRAYLASLIKDRELPTLAALWTQGAVINWEALHEVSAGRKISLPVAPFQETSFWIKRKSTANSNKGLKGVNAGLHPLIDANTSTLDQQSYVKTFDGDESYLTHHLIFGQKLLPGSVYLEMVLAAAKAAQAGPINTIKNITWKSPLIQSQQAVSVSVNLDLNAETDAFALGFSVVSRTNNLALKHHCTGMLLLDNVNSTDKPLQVIDVKHQLSKLPNYVSARIFYDQLKQKGFDYSGDFRSLENIYYSDDKLVAVVKDFSAENQHTADCPRAVIVIDAAFQSLAALINQQETDGKSRYLPASLGKITLLGDLDFAKYVNANLTKISAESLVFDFQILDKDGTCLLVARDFAALPVQAGVTAAHVTEPHKNSPQLNYFETVWESVTTETASDLKHTLMIECGRSAPIKFDGLVVRQAEKSALVHDSLIEGNLCETNLWSVAFERLDCLNPARDNYQLAIFTGEPLDAQPSLSEFFNIIQALVTYINHRNLRPRVSLTLVCYDHPAQLNQYLALSGFMKSLQLENSQFQCTTIRCEHHADDEQVLSALAWSFTRATTSALAGETQLAGSQVLVKKARRIDTGEDKKLIPHSATSRALLTQTDPLPTRLPQLTQGAKLRNRGVYLITGGAGGVGRLIAQYLAHKYQANLILVGRSAINEPLVSLIDSLKNQGSEVIYLQADVANVGEMREVVEKSVARFSRIHGVIHSAGITNDKLLQQKTSEDFESVLTPKIYGTHILDEATADLDLDFMVFFSSLAAIIGNPGQVDYATANTYLDDYASYRNTLVLEQKRAGKTLSINWPYWAEGGMSISDEILQQIEEDSGLCALPTHAGLLAFETALDLAPTQVLVTYGDDKKILAAITGASLVSTTPKTLAEKSILNKGLASEQLSQFCTSYLKELISNETQWDLAKISAKEHFGIYGIDSVMTLNLTKKLSVDFIDLPKTLFFEYTNLESLTQYLVSKHPDSLAALIKEKSRDLPVNTDLPKDRNFSSLALTDSVTASADSPADYYSRRAYLSAQRTAVMNHTNHSARQSNGEAEDLIAIIGISGRYPDADNVLELYENLLVGHDAIREVPSERWNNQEYFKADRNAEGKIYSNWGGFIKGVEKFDPLFFNISPVEAITMDPQERLFLESSWNTIEDAGYTRESLASKKVGVFAGVMWSHYQLDGIDTHPTQSKKLPESSYAAVANRVSYYFGFDGPSLAVDTMCSSSLTAIHLACQAIKHHECELALAGGVNLSLHPHKYLQLCGAQFLSTDGRCRSFGQGGDGYVPGEGVGSVLLKPLSKAIADGDHIYGAIRASVTNHGGKSNGFNVPNAQAQGKLIRSALEKPGVESKNISYIEAHGTGTPLGDPIELQGLKRAFSGLSTPDQCALGSIKSNIGHLEAASGIVGLTKVLLQMKSRKIFPSLHAQQLNSNLDFSDSPFNVQQELSDWISPDKKLLAGISSFGAGGSNAFLLVENVDIQDQSVTNPYPALVVPFSARTEKSLREYLMKVVDYLNAVKANNLPLELHPSFESIVKSLQVGKAHMQERLAVVASSVDELLVNIEQYLANKTGNSPFYRGNGDDLNSELVQPIEELMAGKSLMDMEALADVAYLWSRGYPANFAILFEQLSASKVSLPTYQFDHKNYWYSGEITPRKHLGKSTALSDHGGSSPVATTKDTHNSLIDSVDYEHSMEAGLTFISRLQPDTDIAANHKFQQRALLPGSAYLVMAREVFSNLQPGAAVQMSNVCWHSPLFVDQAVKVFTSVSKKESAYQYRIWTNTENGAVTHGSGAIGQVDLAKPGSIPEDLSPTDSASLKSMIDQKNFYSLLDAHSISYTGRFHCIQSARYSSHKVVANYSLPATSENASPATTRSADQVAIIDAALQSFVLFQRAGSSAMKLPFSIDEVIFYRDPEISGSIVVNETPEGKGYGVILNSHNQACISLQGINFRAVRTSDKTNKSSLAIREIHSNVQAHADKSLAVMRADMREQINLLVADVFCKALNIDKAEIKSNTHFDKLGLESVMAMQITQALRQFAPGIPSTFLFEHNSIKTLVDHLLVDFSDDFVRHFSIPVQDAEHLQEPAVSAVPTGAADTGTADTGMVKKENFDPATNTTPVTVNASKPDHDVIKRSEAIEKIKLIFSASLNLEISEIKGKVSFERYGLESVKAMEITKSLEENFGRLPSTLLYEHNSIDSLVDFLISEKPEYFINPQNSAAAADDDRNSEFILEDSICTPEPESPPSILDSFIHSLSDEALQQHVNQLNDSEVDKLLNKLLNNKLESHTEQNSYES